MYRPVVLGVMCVGAWLGSASWLHGDLRFHDHRPVRFHKPHIFTGHGPAVHHRPVQDAHHEPEISTREEGDAVLVNVGHPDEEGAHAEDHERLKHSYKRFEKNLKQTLAKLHHSFDVLKRKNQAKFNDFQAALEDYESTMKSAQDAVSLIFNNKNEEMMWTSNILFNIVEAFQASSEMMKKKMEVLYVTYHALQEGHLKLLNYQILLKDLLSVRRLPFMQQENKGTLTAADLKKLEGHLRMLDREVIRQKYAP